jgi:hypothetical protein
MFHGKAFVTSGYRFTCYGGLLRALLTVTGARSHSFKFVLGKRRAALHLTQRNWPLSQPTVRRGIPETCSGTVAPWRLVSRTPRCSRARDSFAYHAHEEALGGGCAEGSVEVDRWRCRTTRSEKQDSASVAMTQQNNVRKSPTTYSKDGHAALTIGPRRQMAVLTASTRTRQPYAISA